MKAAAHTIRWFLGIAIILFIVGYYFRNAYKDLPANDIVAFATAPTVQIDDRVTVDTLDFGVPLPYPQPPPEPQDTLTELSQRPLVEALAEDAYKRLAVTVKLKPTGRTVEGLLVGDLVFYVPAAGQAPSRPVHIAAVCRMVPVGGNQWEISARDLPKPVRLSIPDPQRVKLFIHERKEPGKEPAKAGPHAIPLDSIEEIRPLY